MDTFYTELINRSNARGTNAWSHYYYGIFSQVIRENNFKKCAEIGIGYGFHAKEILDTTNVDTLYLVDPMIYYPNDTFANDVVGYGGFDKLVTNMKLNLSEHKTRYVWFRQPSLSIRSSQIEDESLDAVFIDADHSYLAVLQDLPFWWKKLRKGGWLLGDDYASCCPGVTQAVDEFAKSKNLFLDFLKLPNSTYPIYKFIKN